MNWLGRLFAPRKRYGELSEEIRAHLEEKVEELVAGGMARKEAEYTARREFGNVMLTEEEGRETWRWGFVEDFWTDVRYGLRTLRKSPGFTAIAVLTLALGIGGNAAIFSIVDSVLLRPLPYRDAARLVWVSNDVPTQRASVVLEADYFGWQRLNHVFEGVAAYQPGQTLTVTGSHEPEQLRTARVTYNFLDVLGIEPRLGRWFEPQEDRPGAPHAVLLTDALWRARFSANAAILGHPIALDGEPYTVVGILPPEFEFLDNARVDVLVPAALDTYEVAVNKPMRVVKVVARLRKGIAAAAAVADIDAVNQQLWAGYPPPFARMFRAARAQVVPLRERLIGKVRAALMVLLGAVGFVLLIACANIANLQLARGVSREKEIAIRGALGAPHSRIARQLLTENTLIALAGGAGGLGFAAWVVSGLRLWGPADTPHLKNAHLDIRVLLFTVALSLLTGMAFGLAPCLSCLRIPILESLGKTAGREGASVKVRGLHPTLIVGELAMALVLFIGAGLLIRSFVELLSIPPGFDAEGVLTAKISLPAAVYQNPQQQGAFLRQLDERLSAIPGVVSSGLATVLPLQGTNSSAALEIEGRSQLNPIGAGPTADIANVTPGYFSALHIPLREGRFLESRDFHSTLRPVVANEAFIRRYFQGEDPIGKRMRVGSDTWWTIVGVAGDTKQAGLAAPVEPELFPPLGDVIDSNANLVLRTRKDPMALVPAVRAVVSDLDPNLPLFDIEPMNAMLGRQIASQRFNATLLTAFAVFALLLAALGIYGVMAYAVTQRTHEIGVRMALGAAPPKILNMLLARGLAFAGLGIGLGLAASLVLTRFLRSLLFGIQPTDLATFLGVTVVLVGVVFLACWLPARRAMRVDPIVALRYE
jgi:predicted permease